MGCSEGCKKIKTEEHNRLLGLQREQILQEQEAITNAEIENERIRLEKEVDSKFKSEISRYRKEYEENTINITEIFATNKLKLQLVKNKKLKKNFKKNQIKEQKILEKFGAFVRPVLINENEETTKT